MNSLASTVLLCPVNDPESLQIVSLAEAIGLSTVVSRQPHGAKLDREPQLLARVLEANPTVSTVVIVEIPGPSTEEMLRGQGLEVVIIDHHRYDDLDRMQDLSSLEQFRTFFDLSDDRIQELGFDADLLKAVGVIDRGFLWELKKEGFEGERRTRAIAYYRGLQRQLGDARRDKEEAEAQAVWNARDEVDGVIVVRSTVNDISIRDAVSFLVAESYPDAPPTTLIVQGTRRVYVQESDKAKALFDRFGGFTFGRDMCWGKLDDGNGLPSEQEILSIIHS